MTTKRRVTRKAALAVAILGVTLILPGSAVADHNPANHRDPYTCVPGDATNPCPAFEADAFFAASNPVKGSLSSIAFETSQPDRRMPAMKVNYYLPTGWRFGGINDIDPAMESDGVTPATECSQIHNANGSLNNAEALSAGTGMFIQTDGNRFDDPSNDMEAMDPLIENASPGWEDNFPPFAFGYSNPSGDARNPSVSFLNWDAGTKTANFCYHHRRNASRGALPATFIGSGTLTRIDGNPDFDWRVTMDLSHVYKQEGVQTEKANIVKHNISFNALTSGTWNTLDGVRSRQPFSRTPEEAGNYKIRAELFTCADGLLLSTSTGCENDAYTAPLVIDDTLRIAPTPDLVPHDFGKLTGPATSGLCFNSNCPLGLALGQSDVTASWNSPALADGQSVMGYVLTIARPGNQASRKHFRLITNPAAPGGQTSTACGASGTDPCSLDINFPMQSTDGSTTLTNNGKHHLALVTIYMKDARRTDGLCDGGALDDGNGIECAASVVPLRGGQNEGNLIEPGISEWQLLMRPDSWPNVFVETTDDTSNNTYDPITNRIMLVDWALKKAELIAWVTNDKEVSFKGLSNGIVGENGVGGSVVFGSATTAGSTKNFRVDAIVDPLSGFLGGTFVTYDVKNPSLNPPGISGWPDVNDSEVARCWAVNDLDFFGFGFTPRPECALLMMFPL